MAQYLSKFFSLMASYFMLGRKGAVPFGFVLFNSPTVVFLNMLVIEFLQIPVLHFLLGPVASKINLVVKLKEHFSREKTGLMKSKIFRHAQKFGAWGVFLVVAMPAGSGGVLGGIILTKLLGINYAKSLAAMVCGIIVCNYFLVYSVEILKKIFLS